MYPNTNALQTLARRRARIAWMRVWWEGLRREIFRATKAALGR